MIWITEQKILFKIHHKSKKTDFNQNKISKITNSNIRHCNKIFPNQMENFKKKIKSLSLKMSLKVRMIHTKYSWIFTKKWMIWRQEMSPLKRRNSVKEFYIILKLKMTNKTRSKGLTMESMIDMRKSDAHDKNTERNLWNWSIKTINRS